jgi:hypothetical protein
MGNISRIFLFSPYLVYTNMHLISKWIICLYKCLLDILRSFYDIWMVIFTNSILKKKSYEMRLEFFLLLIRKFVTNTFLGSMYHPESLDILIMFFGN